jgi:uncharacterized membrane protein
MTRRILGFVRRLRVRWHWLLAALMAGLLLHFAIVFALTYAMPRRHIATLEGLVPANVMTLLPPITADYQPLPFMMPYSRYAICRYDITKSPLVLRATLGDDDWTIALYDPAGDNVYVVAGADLDRREIELLLTSKQDGLASPLSTAKDAAAASVTVGLASRTGVAILSAPVAGPAFDSTVERLMVQATCQPRSKLPGAGG